MEAFPEEVADSLAHWDRPLARRGCAPFPVRRRGGRAAPGSRRQRPHGGRIAVPVERRRLSARADACSRARTQHRPYYGSARARTARVRTSAAPCPKRPEMGATSGRRLPADSRSNSDGPARATSPNWPMAAPRAFAAQRKLRGQGFVHRVSSGSGPCVVALARLRRLAAAHRVCRACPPRPARVFNGGPDGEVARGTLQR